VHADGGKMLACLELEVLKPRQVIVLDVGDLLGRYSYCAEVRGAEAELP